MPVFYTYVLQLDSGTSPGPYTVYADTVDSNPIEMNVPAIRLRNGVIYTVTPQPSQFIIVNNNHFLLLVKIIWGMLPLCYLLFY